MKILQNSFPLVATLVAVLAACLFLPGLGGGFLLDDAHTIVDNTLIHISRLDEESLLYAASSFHAGGSLRPLAMLSFAIDYWRAGLDAQAFKTTNLAIQALATLALSLFLRRLLLLARWPARRAAVGALLLAGLWAIHPLQVSSVLYVVQRMQTLATLFIVLALWAYLGLRQAQIKGRRGWPHGLLAALFWGLALASKEDAVLLPVYTLVLELTVLRFAAAQPFRIRALRRTYLWMTIAGSLLFLFWALPHFWSIDSYPGRDFNSVERLLTQARVLVTYLSQIVWPLPDRMPFHYDGVEISRSLLQPVTTLPALLAVFGLLAWAWAWRIRRPVFAAGVLLFFAGHFASSNVLGLELAFEHRNHFPLIGAVLAIGDLVLAAWQRWRWPVGPVIAALVVALVSTGTATAIRAHDWGDPLRFASKSVEIAPRSARAWLNLGAIHAGLSGSKADSPHLDRAIRVLEQGAVLIQSPSVLSNLVIYKTIQGSVKAADWQRFLDAVEQTPMTHQTRNIVWVMLANSSHLDEDGLIRTIEIIADRAQFHPRQCMQLGWHVYAKTRQPHGALRHFRCGVNGLRPDHPEVIHLLKHLNESGREGWARELEEIHQQPRMNSRLESLNERSVQ